MPAKKRTLPKNFEALLTNGDLAALKAVFDECDLDARGGFAKQTALAFDACPDALARWLVQRGASLDATDTWRRTPLHTRARSEHGRIRVLLELGADPNADAPMGTPLHAAAHGKRAKKSKLLLEHGAKVDARDEEGLTPLAVALRGCTNAEIEGMVRLARVLIDAGAREPSNAAELVTAIGERFEFHRERFAKDRVEAASSALQDLYGIFDVEPVARRRMHDGKSLISVRTSSWQERHAELWNLLVPSSGPAATVQGEVIRIAGRISREVLDDGGMNWDDEFRAMSRAFVEYVSSGQPLSRGDLSDARAVVAELVKRGDGDTARLTEIGRASCRERVYVLV